MPLDQRSVLGETPVTRRLSAPCRGRKGRRVVPSDNREEWPMIGRRSLLFVASLTFAALVLPHFALAQETVKIGFAGALTGPVAGFGNDIKRAMEMAADAINAKGGIKGRKVELVTRDDEHDPVKTVAAYRNLIERQNVIAMIGATNSASMPAVAPLIHDQY